VQKESFGIVGGTLGNNRLHYFESGGDTKRKPTQGLSFKFGGGEKRKGTENAFFSQRFTKD